MIPFYRRSVKGPLQLNEFLMNGTTQKSSEMMRRSIRDDQGSRYRTERRCAISRGNKVFPGKSCSRPDSRAIAFGLFFSRA